MLAIVRGADLVARLGGDEFVIAYVPNDPSADHLVQRIDDALSLPIEITPTLALSCQASVVAAPWHPARDARLGGAIGSR